MMKREKTNDFLIDDAPMLTPDAGIIVKRADLERGSSVRDESGVMHRSLSRTDVKTWDFSYAILTAEEYAYMVELLRGKAQFRFTFVNDAGEKETVNAYCKETSASYWSRRRGTYKNLQFSVIQC